MKIRSGFVSNSSSSSFIVKGFLIKDNNNLNEEKIAKALLGEEKYNEELKNYIENYSYDKEDAVHEIFYENFAHNNSSVFIAKYEEDGCPRGYDLAIGEYIVCGDDEESLYLPDMVLDNSMTDELKKIKELFNLDEDVKIFCGTRCC